jgi:hypothetical protein
LNIKKFRQAAIDATKEATVQVQNLKTDVKLCPGECVDGINDLLILSIHKNLKKLVHIATRVTGACHCCQHQRQRGNVCPGTWDNYITRAKKIYRLIIKNNPKRVCNEK